MNAISKKWNIRPADPSDLTTLVEFNCRLAEETEGRSLDRGVLSAGIASALSRREACRYFVAEAALPAAQPPPVVGQAMVTFEWSDWRNGMFWWLQSVYVRAEFRGQGVFRLLAERIVEEARADGSVCGLRLYVEAHNRAALATYQRIGFQPSGHLVYEIDWSGLPPIGAVDT